MKTVSRQDAKRSEWVLNINAESRIKQHPRTLVGVKRKGWTLVRGSGASDWLDDNHLLRNITGHVLKVSA